MGTIWKAQDTLLDAPVAVKVIRDDLPEHIDFRERLLSEAKSLYSLNHPNIVRLSRVLENQGVTMIVMEYIDGQTLSSYVLKHKPGIEELLSIFKNILSGIQAAHLKQVIHRDIKSANVMIDREGKVKILDFGISKSHQAETAVTSSNVVMGTIGYMAPELLQGGQASIQSDIYSLGILLYEILKSSFGLNSTSFFDFVQKIRQPEASKDLNKVPMHLRQLILKMCAHDLAHRYKDIDEILADLDPDAAAATTLVNTPVQEETVALLKKGYTKSQVNEIISLSAELVQKRDSTIGENTLIDIGKEMNHSPEIIREALSIYENRRDQAPPPSSSSRRNFALISLVIICAILLVLFVSSTPEPPSSPKQLMIDAPKASPAPTIAPPVKPVLIETSKINDYIAYYAFEGDGKDSGPHHHHGIIRRKTRPIPGIQNNALFFDRAAMEIPYAEHLRIGKVDESYTMSFWFKTASLTSRMDNLAIITTYAKGLPNYFGFLMKDANNPKLKGILSFVFSDKKTGISMVKMNADDDRWHHYVIARDQKNKEIKFFIDGVLHDSRDDNVTSHDNRTPISIGGHLGRYYRFAMDELKVYRRTLNTGEIQRLYFEPISSLWLKGTLTDRCGDHTFKIDERGRVKLSNLAMPSGRNALYFDGSSAMSTTNDFDLGNRDFTIQGWIYPESRNNANIVSSRDGAFDYGGINIGIDSGWSLLVYGKDRKYYGSQHGEKVKVKAWTHVAIVRHGSKVYAYVNGRRAKAGVAHTDIGTKPLGHTRGKLYIGLDGYVKNIKTAFKGHLNNFQIILGKAIHLDDFSPPEL